MHKKAFYLGFMRRAAYLTEKTASTALMRNLPAVESTITPFLETRVGPPGAQLGSVTSTTPSGGVRSIIKSELNPDYRGMGVGRKMYGEHIRKAYEQYARGDPTRYVSSDNFGFTSPDATRVWGSLKSRGYPVTETYDPGIMHPRLTSLGLSPKYMIDLEKMRSFYKDAPVPVPVPVPVPGRSILPSAMNVAKGVGKGFGVGVPVSMALDAVAPTTMSTAGQQQQHPVNSYFNDVAGHWNDSAKAFGVGAATGAVLGGGPAAIPGAIAGGIGDLSHKAWNAAQDVGDIAGNLGGTVMGNIRAGRMENTLKPVGSNSTIIPPLGNSLQNAPTAGGLIKGSADHHNAYVVRLSPAVLHSKKLLRQNPDRHPDKPAVYVGSTGLDPQERFKKHKDGLKQNNLVKQFGVELMPELYQQYNPTTFHKAEEIEKWLATKLRADGYTVAGGNEKTSGERVNEIAWKRTLR